MNFHAVSPKTAAREFSEWASLFSGELFVNLVLYADESGHHDKTGVKKGSGHTLIAGIAAPPAEFIGFCRHWQATLNAYGAPYFHFNEWNSACAIARKIRTPTSKDRTNPFAGWKKEKLDSFLLKLATIIGSSSSIPIYGGFVHTAEFHRQKMAGGSLGHIDPHMLCAAQFFKGVSECVSMFRRKWKGRSIDFIFDQTDDESWQCAILGTFIRSKRDFPHFKGISFEDKKEMPHIPLQAADMIAYRLRQMCERWTCNAVAPWDPIDAVLFKQHFKIFEKHWPNIRRAAKLGLLSHHA